MGTTTKTGYAIRHESLFAQTESDTPEWGPIETAYVWTKEGVQEAGITQEWLDSKCMGEELVKVQVVTTVSLM